jgi:hypothetical protein
MKESGRAAVDEDLLGWACSKLGRRGTHGGPAALDAGQPPEPFRVPAPDRCDALRNRPGGREPVGGAHPINFPYFQYSRIVVLCSRLHQ